jgi:hypothetical protein
MPIERNTPGTAKSRSVTESANVYEVETDSVDDGRICPPISMPRDRPPSPFR